MSNNKKSSEIDKNLSNLYNLAMYSQVIEYDPLRDVKEVEDGLAVNIDEALKTGIVKDDGTNLDNNGIDDPNAVIGLVRDEFAAIDAQRILRKVGKDKSKAAAAEKAAAEAAAAGAPAPTNAPPAE